MTLTFVKDLPKKGSGLKAVVTEEMYDIADQCREHVNQWTCIASRLAKPSIWYPLRDLDIRVEIRGVSTEKYTIEKGKNKGQEKERTLFDVWVGYIVPTPVNGTEPTAAAATEAAAAAGKRGK